MHTNQKQNNIESNEFTQLFSLPDISYETNPESKKYATAIGNNLTFDVYQASAELFAGSDWARTPYLKDGLVFIGTKEVNWELQNMIYLHNVPKEFEAFVLFNEIYCPNVKEAEWKCVKMVEEELKLVKEEIFDDFLEWRLNFFQNNVSMYRDEKCGIDEIYARELEKCVVFLTNTKKERLTSGKNFQSKIENTLIK